MTVDLLKVAYSIFSTKKIRLIIQTQQTQLTIDYLKFKCPIQFRQPFWKSYEIGIESFTNPKFVLI
jgi:hypothetical protein